MAATDEKTVVKMAAASVLDAQAGRNNGRVDYRVIFAGHGLWSAPERGLLGIALVACGQTQNPASGFSSNLTTSATRFSDSQETQIR